MLVLCVGMYRACSTWQYGVVGLILEKHRSGCRLGFVEGIYFPEKVDETQIDGDWFVLKAHDAHELFADLLSGRRAIGFYSYRDLRDVVFSYIHKTGTEFDALMERGFVELCLNNDRFWRAQPGMLVQSYDDLIANPVRGVEQIADHLGVALDAGEAEAIAEAMSWESNRRKVESLADRLRTEGATLSSDDQSKFDPVSLLHWNHIRPAAEAAVEKPDTSRQRQVIEQSCRPWLIRQGFESPESTPPEAVESVVRTSYALSGVDVRLDRLFRGVKASVIDFDAPDPIASNASYYLYVRGWRSVNVGTTHQPRDRFVVDRPRDLNLAFRFDEIVDPSATQDDSTRWANFVASHRIPHPDLVVFNPTSDVDRLLGLILPSSWRPKVFVVDEPRSVIAGVPAWEARLEEVGYVVVPDLEGPKIYLRADLVQERRVLARPLGAEDHFRLDTPITVPLNIGNSPPRSERTGEDTDLFSTPSAAISIERAPVCV